MSKLGDGLGDPTNTRKAGEGTVSYGAKQEEAREGIVKNLKFLGQDGAILTAGNSGKTPPGQINGKGKGGGKESEQFQYFYHPDHLGSTSYITDASGEVYQHLEYFAFGETFVEEHSNTHRTPYLFNGKELDEETGLYYYGARYYDAKTSVFLSVDPLADKFSAWNPYIFAFDNPVRFNDPTGMWPDETTNPGEERAMAGKKVVAQYKTNGTTYSNEKREFGLNAKYADCSSMSCTILEEAGQGDLFDGEKYTGQGSGSGIQGKIREKSGASSLKEPYRLNNPKVGDIMMWKGHMAVVVEVNNGEVKFANMGVKSKAGIRTLRFSNNEELLNAAHIWSSDFWGFWTPESIELPTIQLKEVEVRAERIDNKISTPIFQVQQLQLPQLPQLKFN